jgi:hypothetical protein
MQVQYFGAQSVQLKISRDFKTFPPDSYPSFREGILNGIFSCCEANMSNAVIKKMCLGVLIRSRILMYFRIVADLQPLFSDQSL